MINRMTYLHLVLHHEVMQLSAYAPLAAAGLSRGISGMSVEEPPDDDDSPKEGGEGGTSGETNEGSDAAGEKESSAKSDSTTKKSKDGKKAYPECWFEDEESGAPLRWHLFVGVLHDLMKGRALINHPTQIFFLPWRIRVHFTAYPTDRLLPLDDGLDDGNDNDDHSRVTTLVQRIFRNSLKQALFMQYASSKVAMSITKYSHGKIWDAVSESNYASYHEVNAGLQSGINSPSMSTSCFTTLAASAAVEDEKTGIPQLIPVRLMVNGLPAIQKPIKHEKDNQEVECTRPTELLETLGTHQAPPYTTLGDVLSGCLPNHFQVDPSTSCAAAIPNRAAHYFIQGVRPSLKCAVVDLW
eukprot:CAMPEP_0172549582 /NCGR_PEP_ID=MMETSP1067-20121228/18607_1 /TAXON_ID=265564 ORGANISM="Thalassiosira punctigera, Strain Tpunct2005C2" /NCGR_SAMPLE_ID=MMETSP1067 /ASSEMBLY_ACC=CAM_ASM_000444 /LENGTH=354 /DNA_ID=CAMNT_0013336977 /DNA_START=533 /DNA_END=1594 /DNA_ORIENTATION=+